jgi:hypothetical protein
MFTKPLTRQTITTLDTARDTDSINRLLIAAAISPRFCTTLLEDPQHALRAGFGGEAFPLSQMILDRLGSIRASSLPEFVFKLNEVLTGSSRTT